MNILILDDDRWMAGYFKEIIIGLLLDMRREHVVKEATSLSAAQALLNEGFLPDLALVDYDLGPVERGPGIFPLLREKTPNVFICMMTIREKTPSQSVDILITKGCFSDQIPGILHQAILKKK